MSKTLSAINAAKKQSAYTMIEILVVLLIVGLISSIVAPSLFKYLNAFQRKDDINALALQLSQLPLEARLKGADIVLASTSELDPKGISAKFEPQLIVRKNGFCEASEVSVITDGAEKKYKVTPPFCELTATGI